MAVALAGYGLIVVLGLYVAIGSLRNRPLNMFGFWAVVATILALTAVAFVEVYA